MKIQSLQISLFTLTMMFFSDHIIGQSATVAAGGDGNSGSGSISFSVGQPVYVPMTSSSGTVLQGVQVPYEFFVVGIDEFPGIQLEMSAYPNPTRSVVSLRIEEFHRGNLNYRLSNNGGQLISESSVINTITEIPMQDLAAGTYMLTVFDTASALKTFSIIKTN